MFSYTDSLSKICVFLIVKLPRVTQKSVPQENAFKKSKKPVAFIFRKTIGSNNSFTLIENKFQLFKITKFEFKVIVYTVAYAYGI